MNNFIVDFDLHCSPKAYIGLMGSSLFAGFLIGALIIPWLADSYGRKRIFRIFFLLHIIGVATIILAPNLYVIYAGFLMIGLASSARTAVGLSLCLELMETRYHNISMTTIKSLESGTPILFAILMEHVDNYWKHYYIAGLIVSVIIYILALFIPESPRWY